MRRIKQYGRRIVGRNSFRRARDARFTSPVSRFPRHAGFTLIEVLLAITLLGMIMVLAYQGLRTGAHSAERGEAAIERVNRLRLAQEFVRGQLSRARPMMFENDQRLGAIVFEGGPETLRFAAPMPGYLSYGGPYVQSLSLVRGDDGLDLVFDHHVLRYGPEAERGNAGDDERDPVLLIGGLDDARFSYLAPPERPDGEPEWVDEWRDVGSLPLAVRLEGEFREQARLHWPTLTVATRVDYGSGASRFSRAIEFGPNLNEPRQPRSNQ